MSCTYGSMWTSILLGWGSGIIKELDHLLVDMIKYSCAYVIHNTEHHVISCYMASFKPVQQFQRVVI